MNLPRRAGLASNTLLPIGVLLVLGLIWGSSTNIARFVAQADVPPVSYAFWNLFIGALLLLLVNMFRRKRIPTGAGYLRYYAIAGMVSSGIPTANMFLCLNHISVGAMSLALTTVPLFTYLFSLIAGMERVHPVRAIGIGLGLAGTLIVILPDGGLPETQSLVWFGLAFVTPIGYSCGTVYTARYKPADIDSLVGANAMMFASATFLFILATIFEDLYPIWAKTGLVNNLIVLHGALSATAFTLFFMLVRIAGPVYFSQVAYLVTFFGIAIAMVVFGERYSVWLWLALALTVFGVWMVNRAQSAARVQTVDTAN